MTEPLNPEPVEGIDYIIEPYKKPNGPPCEVCGYPLEKNYKDNWFCEECIAQYYDQFAAKQDTRLNMRINARLLDEIKATAKRQGEANYQRFIRNILLDVVTRQQKAG